MNVTDGHKAGSASALRNLDHRQDEEEGEPGDAHQQFTLFSPGSRGAGVKAAS